MIPSVGITTVKTHNQMLGRRGEDAAARWYIDAGYRILDRNWRCRQGEIDLVVEHKATVVFVEVKTRSSGRFGSGFDAVNRSKQLRLRRLASSWLAERRRHAADGSAASPSRAGYVTDVRFDVVDVDGRGHVRVRHGCF